MLKDHAYARTTSGNLPLIGVPKEASEMSCDLCGDVMYWLDVKLNAAGNQFLCLQCRTEKIGNCGKYPILLEQ